MPNVSFFYARFAPGSNSTRVFQAEAQLKMSQDLVEGQRVVVRLYLDPLVNVFCIDSVALISLPCSTKFVHRRFLFWCFSSLSDRWRSIKFSKHRNKQSKRIWYDNLRPLMVLSFFYLWHVTHIFVVIFAAKYDTKIQRLWCGAQASGNHLVLFVLKNIFDFSITNPWSWWWYKISQIEEKTRLQAKMIELQKEIVRLLVSAFAHSIFYTSF